MPKSRCKTFIIESSFSLSRWQSSENSTKNHKRREEAASKWRIFRGYAQWPKIKWKWKRQNEKRVKTFLVLKRTLLPRTIVIARVHTHTQNHSYSRHYIAASYNWYIHTGDVQRTLNASGWQLYICVCVCVDLFEVSTAAAAAAAATMATTRKRENI